MKQKQEKCCGSCCYYEHGNSNTGFGECHNCQDGMYCRPDGCCYRYISKEQARYYITVLTQHNKWRRNDNVPNSTPMQDPKEIGKAIDFAVEYLKTFIKLKR